MAVESLDLRRFPAAGGISPADHAVLRTAHEWLEHPSLAVRLSNVVGLPIEEGLKLLPRRWYRRLHHLSERVLRRGLEQAIVSLGRREAQAAGDDLHRMLVLGSGAAGGFFGLPALLVELPLSTFLILRSIADIARSEGEDLASWETRLAALQVFALGARSHDDDAAETGYYGVRFALGLHFSLALNELLEHGVEGIGLPASIRFVRAVASRFALTISDKAAVQLVPVAGAVGGAAINLVFMNHYQETARGHFTVRRLERRYGTEVVREAYLKLGASGG